MAYLDDLQPLRFDRHKIPYQRITVRGVQREHIHEYPHVKGGAPEKQGRKLYEVQVSSKFDERIASHGNRALLRTLNSLQELFDNGETKALYVPNLGEMKAYNVNWSRELNVQWRSGEAVELTFREDPGNEFLKLAAVKFAGGAVASEMVKLDTLVPSPKPNALQQIQDAINSVLAIRDYGLMWAGFVEEKIEGIRLLFEELESTWDLIEDPENWPIHEQLLALLASVVNLGEEVFGLGGFETYTTPKVMTTDEASEAIYGDTEHAIDIMNWNSVGDPYHIPAGTDLKYIKEA